MKKIEAKQNITRTLAEAFPEFLNSCRVKNLRPASIESYQDKYNKLISIVSDNTLCSSVDSKTVDCFILALQKQALADASVNSYIRCNRAFFYWCMANEYMPKFKILLIKEDTENKVAYSDAQLKVLLKKPKTTDFAEYRTWVICNYLLGTGNRLSTLINLNKGDLDLINKSVMLRHTKNRRPMIIPIGDTLCKVLQDYIKLFLGDFSDDAPLFPNQYGKRFCDGGVGIQHSIVTYNHKRGIQLTSVHAFRHAFAKNFILNGGDIFTLQKLLGHNSLEMVRRYVNLYGVDLRKGYNEYNPLERLLASDRGTTIKAR